MGLPVRVSLYGIDGAATEQAVRAAFARIADLDRVMSDYRPDSEVRRLERRTGEWIPVSGDLFEVLARALDIARETDGAFDPSIAPLVSLWREARTSRRLPDRRVLSAARAHVGWRAVELDRARRAVRFARDGMRLDLGGIAKGYILQEALRILKSNGITQALIEAGGDIVVGDAPPGRPGWRIDADDADEGFRVRASRLTNAALATSGATAQFVEIDGVRYSHVIDPRTGFGVTNHFVAHVIADDAATADALATALTIVGPERAAATCAKFPGVFASVGREPRP